MELTAAKVVAIVALTAGSLLVGLLPAWFSAYGRSRHPLLLSGLLCFGGGVLLSTSLVHMLPEVRENLPEHKDCAEALFVCGFFALYALDELVHLIFPHGAQSAPGAAETRPLLHPHVPHNPSFARVGSLGLLFALAVHAVLEGLAVGLETSSTQVLLLFGAIASHKLVVGFCLGVELAAECTVRRHFVSILVFSMGSPLGIGLGMVFSNIPKDIESYLLPVLQGLAGGTLFYVSVSEVLPRERARWHKPNAKRYAGLFQFLCVLIGFSIMTALTKYMEH